MVHLSWDLFTVLIVILLFYLSWLLFNIRDVCYHDLFYLLHSGAIISSTVITHIVTLHSN